MAATGLLGLLSDRWAVTQNSFASEITSAAGPCEANWPSYRAERCGGGAKGLTARTPNLNSARAWWVGFRVQLSVAKDGRCRPISPSEQSGSGSHRPERGGDAERLGLGQAPVKA